MASKHRCDGGIWQHLRQAFSGKAPSLWRRFWFAFSPSDDNSDGDTLNGRLESEQRHPPESQPAQDRKRTDIDCEGGWRGPQQPRPN